MRATLLTALAALLTLGRFAAAESGAPSPSRVEPIARESELLRLTLTAEAQKRLGLTLTRVATGSAIAVRHVAGEVVIPPNAAGGLPTNSLTNLQQIGAQQATADGEVSRATAQATLARKALERAENLVRREAGSVRARDEATAALSAAEVAVEVAKQQRKLLGLPVEELATQPLLWLRVPVFGSDINQILRAEQATIQALGGGEKRTVSPVKAPPSANSAAGTVDLYYALRNADAAFRVGQRVSVALPRIGRNEGFWIPASAIVRDIYGGEWVYQRTGKDTFVRQRIEVAAENDGEALLARGLHADAEVVTAGAAELFGTEFGAAH